MAVLLTKLINKSIVLQTFPVYHDTSSKHQLKFLIVKPFSKAFERVCSIWSSC